MKEFRVINSKGLELEVTENELYKIAEHWIDEHNQFEHDYAESNGENLEERLYDYPYDFSEVEEILIEYMQCKVIEIDNDGEVYRNTERLYHTLLG